MHENMQHGVNYKFINNSEQNINYLSDKNVDKYGTQSLRGATRRSQVRTIDSG
jgi:hypothetical protein